MKCPFKAFERTFKAFERTFKGFERTFHMWFNDFS